jgi:hypothetical protein
LKKEIKQEIMAEVGKETTNMRNEYNAKILNMGGRIDDQYLYQGFPSTDLSN